MLCSEARQYLADGLLPSVLKLTHLVTRAVASAGAASTRVANELGSGKPLRAEHAAYTAIVMETLLMLGIVAVGIGLRDVWAYLFTDAPEVCPNL